MLAASRLYSFLDHKNGFNVHFLEGQKIIHDLVIMHPMTPQGFAYFRDTFLGILPIIFFLKPTENIGIYIDSEDPYFRLKIETNSAGHTRTLLLPEEFNLFPMSITGKVRLTKISPSQKTPYTSVLELNKVSPKDVLNQILAESYQTNSEVVISESSDQAVMVTKLPSLNVNSTNNEDSVPRKEFIKKNKHFFSDVFDLALNDIEVIVKKFEDQGFSYLGSKQLDFFCPCSHERMVLNLRGLYSGDTDDLFSDTDSLEIKCDYCRKEYKIMKSEVIGS